MWLAGERGFGESGSDERVETIIRAGLDSTSDERFGSRAEEILRRIRKDELDTRIAGYPPTRNRQKAELNELLKSVVAEPQT